MAEKNRLIRWVPIGLKALFEREAAPQGGDLPENVVSLHKIVEIDPTHPGLDEEMMAALRGDYDEDEFDELTDTQEAAGAETADTNTPRRFTLIQGGLSNKPS